MEDPALETLLQTLLMEGYALYPYTPGSAKNATPTPFGIVYPPRYAEGISAAFDHLRMRGVVTGEPAAVIEAEVRFLHGAEKDGRHQAVERRLTIAPRTLAELGPDGFTEVFEFGTLQGRMRLRAEPLGEDRWQVSMCVHNTTPGGGGLDRADALRLSLLSAHPVVRVTGGLFTSPLEAGCESVNTFPVLATPAEDVLLGATIMLPDHPQLAPESRGDLFDGTEIEEALLLHVLALSDDERNDIARDDPAVRDMIARAAAATPEEVIGLHGRMTLHEPGEGHL
jgi:hypothetical protein